jgi:hypothetical protein
MARQKKTDRLDDRLVILVESGFKAEVQGMYQEAWLLFPAQLGMR